jgi:hypothetical protein
MWHVSFSPGVGLTSQKTTATTHGETGTINCVGAINGHDVTGPGTLGLEGVIRGTCLGGTGSATLSLTVATSAGSEKVSFPATITWGPGVGFKFSDSLVGPLTFAFYPTVGDCVTTAATEAVQVGEFVLKS